LLGFRIDSSENLLSIPNTLIGTLEELYKNAVETPWINSPGFLVVPGNLGEEGKPQLFTSFLSPILVNGNSWGGSDLFLEFSKKIGFFLDSRADPWTNDELKHAFEHDHVIEELRRSFLPDSKISQTYFLNRELIGLYCWMDILRKAIDKLPGISENIFSVKDLCHKPLTYLALNLRILMNSRLVCAFKIFEEASEKGILPFSVARLFQEMFFCSVLTRARLHLEKGTQEEEVNLEKIPSEKRWELVTITKVLLKPLLEKLQSTLFTEQNFRKKSAHIWLRDIFSSVWGHYCSQRDKWRKEFPGHRLISCFEEFPNPSGFRPVIPEWRQRKKEMLGLFFLDPEDEKFRNELLDLRITRLEQEELIVTRLHPSAVKQLQKKGFLSENGELDLSQAQVNQEKGRHLVMHVTLSENSENFTIYIKIFPEMPVLELAVTEFAVHLVGPMLPWICLVKLFVGKKTFPAIISEGIPGNLISGNHPPYLDPHFFSLRVLLAALINQEDAKPSNIICARSPKNPKNFNLVSIDNDRSFYPALHVDEKKRSVAPLVKDITFCFDEMNSAISPLAREIFLTLEPYLFLANWLNSMNFEMLGIDTMLFSKEEIEAYFPESGIHQQFSRFGRFFSQIAVPEESLISLMFPSNLIKNLYTKMMKLRNFLLKNPKSTHMGLLTVAEPHLSKYYLQMLKIPGNAHTRFLSGFGHFYGLQNDFHADCVTVSTTFRTLESLSSGEEISLEKIKMTKKLIGTCFSELEETHKFEIMWRSVLAGFCSNPETFQISFNLFQQLPGLFQEKVINNLDFSQLYNLSFQSLLLKNLEKLSHLRHLRLCKSKVVSDQHLKNIFTHARELQAVSIIGCELVTPRMLEYLGPCPNLDKVFLSDLDWKDLVFVPPAQISSMKAWAFPSLVIELDNTKHYWITLKILRLKDLVNIKTLNLPLLNLEYLHIFNCASLSNVWLKNPTKLKSLIIYGCKNLQPHQNWEFLKLCPNLKSIKLDLPTILQQMLQDCSSLDSFLSSLPVMLSEHLFFFNKRENTQTVVENLIVFCGGRLHLYEWFLSQPVGSQTGLYYFRLLLSYDLQQNPASTHPHILQQFKNVTKRVNSQEIFSSINSNTLFSLDESIVNLSLSSKSLIIVAHIC
jgi:hypothetical protein